MTALEALYNKFLADEEKTYDDFHDAFRDCCPQIFFKGIGGLCDRETDGKDVCCKCWLQEVDIYHMVKVVSVCRDGTVDCIGEYVKYGWVGVRPALTITDCAFANLRVGERYVKYDFPWIKIDDMLAIAEVPIGFNRFAIKSNDYKESEVRQYLLNWVKGRKGLIK